MDGAVGMVSTTMKVIALAIGVGLAIVFKLEHPIDGENPTVVLGDLTYDIQPAVAPVLSGALLNVFSSILTKSVSKKHSNYASECLKNSPTSFVALIHPTFDSRVTILCLPRIIVVILSCNCIFSSGCPFPSCLVHYFPDLRTYHSTIFVD